MDKNGRYTLEDLERRLAANIGGMHLLRMIPKEQWEQIDGFDDFCCRLRNVATDERLTSGFDKDYFVELIDEYRRQTKIVLSRVEMFFDDREMKIGDRKGSTQNGEPFYMLSELAVTKLENIVLSMLVANMVDTENKRFKMESLKAEDIKDKTGVDDFMKRIS